MFETIAIAPPDAILGLTDAFQQDTNPEKINLSVGVYKDANGQTPVLRAVKEAEQKILETQTSKSYLGIDGLPGYCDQVAKMLFADQIDRKRLAILQTPGGTGAVRIAGEFVGSQFAGSKVWISNPTWANHPAIFHSAGVATEQYRYLNGDRTGLDFDALLEDLSSGPVPGDAVLLHACCHNPTGVDPTADQWRQIAELLKAQKLLPIVDFAYQGFGQGLQEDAEGLRILVETCPEILVCSSFSKNFGLYSERVGALTLVAQEPAAASAALSQLKRLVRTNYSNPPRHGATIVATILQDPQLTETWETELTEMRNRIAGMRTRFVQQMKTAGVNRDFQFLLQQNGMFSFSGLNPMQVDELRSKHSVYIVGSGRINVAGMTEHNLPRLATAIAAVL
ncbi:Aspartate aminotransferase [Roseimaritima multifibrata]|uniref:Aspartate aminotransferase n=1 Tax=Roseimaritima multifibrata TaxID=1930274 RepID=A0A517MC17_9BACT|nr:amino acid aminotransferase [Roseimaritima multifibrata]QDS92411.1 Aspartate aminotransferase [Roseimaritima multifibrata]